MSRLGVNIGIIDDNSIISDYVRKVINRTLFSINVDYKIFQFNNAEDFLINKDNILFNIIILDIELPKMSGLDLSIELRKKSVETIIIFLTSYENYVKDAFGINVHQYILKNDIDYQLSESILEIIEFQNKKIISYLFRTKDGELKLNHNEIVYINFEERKPKIYTINNSYKANNKSMKEVAKILDQNIFVQINSACIINVHFIRRISNLEVELVFESKKLNISRGKYRVLSNKYRDYLIVGQFI